MKKSTFQFYRSDSGGGGEKKGQIHKRIRLYISVCTLRRGYRGGEKNVKYINVYVYTLRRGYRGGGKNVNYINVYVYTCVRIHLGEAIEEAKKTSKAKAMELLHGSRFPKFKV